MKTRTKGSPYLLVTVSILFGIISIATLLMSLFVAILETTLSVNLQWLSGYMGWLGSTRLVVYLGWLGLPGLIIGIIALIKKKSKIEKGFAIFGMILGLLGILWALFISSMYDLANYL
jgi:hypothetical protein